MATRSHLGDPALEPRDELVQRHLAAHVLKGGERESGSGRHVPTSERYVGEPSEIVDA